jgi:hypothetical protein
VQCTTRVRSVSSDWLVNKPTASPSRRTITPSCLTSCTQSGGHPPRIRPVQLFLTPRYFGGNDACGLYQRRRRRPFFPYPGTTPPPFVPEDPAGGLDRSGPGPTGTTVPQGRGRSVARVRRRRASKVDRPADSPARLLRAADGPAGGQGRTAPGGAAGVPSAFQIGPSSGELHRFAGILRQCHQSAEQLARRKCRFAVVCSGAGDQWQEFGRSDA